MKTSESTAAAAAADAAAAEAQTARIAAVAASFTLVLAPALDAPTAVVAVAAPSSVSAAVDDAPAAISGGASVNARPAVSRSSSSSSEATGADSDLGHEAAMSANSGSDSELPEAAGPKARGMVCMFTWPCPREYPSDLAVRKSSRCLKPEDISKPELLNIFKAALLKHQLMADLVLWVAVAEKHKRYNRTSTTREVHYHIVMKMRSAFAHAKLKDTLARQGVRGEFTFKLIGLAANLKYILEPSSQKLPHDIDSAPEVWPAGTKLQPLLLISPQQAARNNVEVQNQKPQKQRTRLLWSEVTDLFVEHAIMSTKGAWQLAKRLKVDGQPLLWESLFAAPSVAALMNKFLEAWHERPSSGSLLTKCEFELRNFHVPAECREWVETEHKLKTLIIYGLPKRGKTELACALMLKVRPAGFHFLNTTDDLKRVDVEADEGLVIDETLFSDHTANDCKAWCDLKFQRFTQARNNNGKIPQGTPRIFTTNYPFEEFWPRDLLKADHIESIRRRMMWVSCAGDLRNFSPDQPNLDARTSSSRSVASKAQTPRRGSSSSSSGAPAVLQQILGALSPNTQQKISTVLISLTAGSAAPDPAAPEAERALPDEEDVFQHGGSLDYSD